MTARANLWVSLGIYMVVNLSLSTCNKLVLEKSHTPWLLTAMHATATSVGCLACLGAGVFKMTKLTTNENITLVLFSTLFTINIAMSNLSLSLVSLAFHQVARSTGPIFTVLAYRFWYQKTYEVQIYASVLAMTLGVGLATYGDYYFTIFGFSITLFGIILATVKTIATNQLMTGNLKLHPLEVLLRMCPLAAVQSLICAAMAGELHLINANSAIGHPYQHLFSRKTQWILPINAFLAFSQNLSSFHTNRTAGALTIAVCANLKQAFTMGVAVALFKTRIGLAGGLGIGTVLAGSACYSWAVVKDRERQRQLRSVEHARTASMEEKGFR